MRSLASFVMRGRWQAALVAAVTALLFLLVPPVLIVSGAAVALVTLRQGDREGFLLCLIAGLGTAALAFPIIANGVMLAGGILLLFWLPICVLAMVLRSTVSLARTLVAATTLGGLAVLAFYLFLGDPGAWWLDVFREIKPILEGSGLITDEKLLNQALELLAPFMPGLIVANMVAYMLFSLLLGRWWQALLFNPGGFREEFHALRLGRGMALVAVAIFGLAIALEVPLVANLALVLGVIYMLQGIAVVHGAVGRANLSRGWLVGLYVLMVFALVQLFMLLCLLGVVDAWIDVRSRIKPRAGTP